MGEHCPLCRGTGFDVSHPAALIGLAMAELYSLGENVLVLPGKAVETVSITPPSEGFYATGREAETELKEEIRPAGDLKEIAASFLALAVAASVDANRRAASNANRARGE